MADLLAPQLGYEPWCPAESASLVVTWNFYDAPLTGIVLQHGVRHLFHCLVGGGRDVTLWVYAPLTSDDEQWLSSIEGPERLTAIERAIFDRNVTVVVAHDSEGIIWSEPLDLTHKSFEDFVETVRMRLNHFMQDLHQATERLSPVKGQ